MELFHMINPVNHTRTPAGSEQYRAEPYAIAADVYAHPMHIGRGGWTWYTGSAGWMYQAAIRHLLGVQRRGSTLVIDPCIPANWPEYSLDWTIGRTRYHVSVRNPEHRSHGVASASLDGVSVDVRAVPLVDDGREHQIIVVLGTPAATSQPAAAVPATATAPRT
jgi:cyclic beta-1,2-glucan synthetase